MILSKPTQIVRQAAISRASERLSDTRKLQYEFWSLFRERLCKRPEIPSVQSARPQYWFDVSLGRSHIKLSNIANTYENRIGIRVYISNRIAESALPQLVKLRSEIEREIGDTLQWNPNPENKDKIIALTREADLSDRSKWDEYVEWLVDYTVKFRTVFSPRIKNMHFSARRPETAATDGQ